MPYATEWVEPEELLTHKGVTVWHTYWDDEVEQGINGYWFTLDALVGLVDGDELWVFDFRDLHEHGQVCPTDAQDAIRQAIDVGWLTKEGVKM